MQTCTKYFIKILNLESVHHYINQDLHEMFVLES